MATNLDASDNVIQFEGVEQAAEISDSKTDKCSRWLDSNKWETETETTESDTVSTCDSASIVDNVVDQLALENVSAIAKSSTYGDIEVIQSKRVHIGNKTYITVYTTPNTTKKEKSECVREIDENLSDTVFIGKDNVSINHIPRVLSIVPRRRWLAQEAIEFQEFASTPDMVVISTESTSNGAENIALVRDIQMVHIEAKKWHDISYNFLIGEDGRVYEGRGWTRIGGHSPGYKTRAIGVAFIGCYATREPPERSVNAYHNLVSQGVEMGYLDPLYSLLVQSQCSPIETPADALFTLAQSWPRWTKELPTHTASESSLKIEDNISMVKDIQIFHMLSRKWSDISYNFLIGEDGYVYEGRGWHRVGAHTLGYNIRSIGVAFIGCYMTSVPADHSIKAFHDLISLGVSEGHITPEYRLQGHCQCRVSESPGKCLYDLIKYWPNWSAEAPSS